MRGAAKYARRLPMLKLRRRTSHGWTEAVLENLSAFLQDHAACERKASATALALVAHYPDRPELVKEMIHLAQEELEHFRQVVELMQARDVTICPDKKDPYVGGLMKHMRRGRDAYFLDRLLIGGIVEARGCERFGLLSEALEPGPLKQFYEELTRAEARHHGLFLRLARTYFSESEVAPRLDELLHAEEEIVDALPFRAALH